MALSRIHHPLFYVSPAKLATRGYVSRRVFIARGKWEVGGAQLFQVAESLKFGSIYDFYHQRGELDESVNGVIYLLHSVVDLNVHLLIQIVLLC